MPAIGHARGLLLLARGEVPAAYQELQAASESWQVLRRFWEGTWVRLDLAEAAARARRRGEAAVLTDEVRAIAAASGAAVLAAAADRLSGSFDQAKPAEPWYPLSEREFEVARLVAAGLTNRQIAEQLVLAPKTISAHVTHILTKLGAARRAEIGAWCATVSPTSSMSVNGPTGHPNAVIAASTSSMRAPSFRRRVASPIIVPMTRVV